MVLSLAINVAVKGGTEKVENPQHNEQIEKASKPVNTPVASPGSLPTMPPPTTTPGPVKK